MRTLAQAGLLPTVIRLSDEAETAINLARPDEIGGEAAGRLPDDHRLRGRARRRSRPSGPRSPPCSTGLGGTALGEEPGESWAHGRFDAPYLRDSLLDVGVLVETLETATFWSDVDAALRRREGGARGSRSASRRWCSATSPTSTRPAARSTSRSPRRRPTTRSAQWLAAKAAASDAIIDAGATITHHHAVGTDHKPWLAAGDRRRSASRSCARSRPTSTRPASSTRGC